MLALKILVHGGTVPGFPEGTMFIRVGSQSFGHDRVRNECETLECVISLSIFSLSLSLFRSLHHINLQYFWL